MAFRRWGLTCFVGVMLPVLIGLGCWQLERREQKIELDKLIELRRTAQPVPFEALKCERQLSFILLKLNGRFDQQQHFFRDNQLHDGQQGLTVFTRFMADSGESLWVQRGWLPHENRNALPRIETPNETVEITGTLYQPDSKPFVLAEEPQNGQWPKRMQGLDLAMMNVAVQMPSHDFYLVLNEGEAGSFIHRPVAFNSSAHKHLGYAVQWFLMALVLAVMYIRAIRKQQPNNTTYA